MIMVKEMLHIKSYFIFFLSLITNKAAMLGNKLINFITFISVDVQLQFVIIVKKVTV